MVKLYSILFQLLIADYESRDYDLGNGQGYYVQQVIALTKKVCGFK